MRVGEARARDQASGLHDTPENKEFVSKWMAYAKEKNLPDAEKRVTNDPMEATYIGIKMWPQAAEQAHTTNIGSMRASSRRPGPVRALSRPLKYPSARSQPPIRLALYKLLKNVRIVSACPAATYSCGEAGTGTTNAAAESHPLRNASQATDGTDPRRFIVDTQGDTHATDPPTVRAACGGNAAL